MNAVLGYSQLMLRDPDVTAAAKTSLNIINRSGEHLLGLINDILDMSKIEAGKVELNPVVFDLESLLEDLSAMFRLRANAKGLEFEVLCESEPWPHVVADLGKVRQVLINLLSNAIKFTKQGSVQLRLSISSREENQLWLIAEVEDTGSGIDPEEQRQLFRPFVQSETGRSSQAGTGLGLAISREYARIMGGEIALNSEMGRGTTFRFEIPIEASSAGAAAGQKVNCRVLSLQPQQRATSVLIVDDEPNNRGWLNQFLTSIGFSVREAGDGEAAIRVYAEWRPQLILMDMRMPVMDGLQATRAIRSRLSKKDETAPVIIALTASAMGNDRKLILDSGADDFMSKPCHVDELLEKIRTHLSVAYVYAEDETIGPLDPAAASPLPAELADELRHAVINGEKNRLDTLIGTVAANDSRLGHTMKNLADNYEYEALTELLEKTCL
jgi:CheY-like chemotaxis protein